MSNAQTMKIYSIISRIEEELRESPSPKFANNTNKRIVEIERLFDLLEDLKVTIPEDIRRATGILAEADNMIADAKDNCDEIIENAQKEANQILEQAQTSAEQLYKDAQTEFESRVSDSEVYKMAFEKANEITAEAENNANQIYNGARKYADDLLTDLQKYLSEYHSLISDNRKELNVVPEDKQPNDLVTEPAKEFDEKIAQSKQIEYKEFTDPSPRPVPKKPFFENPQDFEKPAAVSVAYSDDSDDYDEEEEKPKKKSFFQKMFEIEDDDDEDFEDDYEDDEEDEEEEKKPKKKLPKFFR